MRIIIFTFLVAFLFSTDLYAQVAGLHTPVTKIEDEVYFDPKDSIHLPHLGQNEILDHMLDITMKRRGKTSRSSSVRTLADNTPFHIPVKIWVYHNDDGSNPALSDNEAHALLDSVNKRYAEGGTGIQFYMRCPIQHVYSTRFNNINNDVEFWATTSLMYHDSHAINWHLVRKIADANGTASFPWNPIGAPFSFAIQCSERSTIERVITTVHEIGHTLGVLHTHDNIRGVSNYNGDADNCFMESVSRTRKQKIGCVRTISDKKCEINGDALCDTEAAPNRKNLPFINVNSCTYTGIINADRTNSVGIGTDSWGDTWRPQTRNYMAYVWNDLCRGEFTQGQIAVMHMSIMQYMVSSGTPWYNLNSITLSGTVNSGEYESHVIPQKIEAAPGSNTYTINAGATVNLHAGEEIILRNGFHARAGSNFSAKVGAIPPTSCYTVMPSTSNITRSNSNSIAFSSNLSQEDIDECMSIIRKGLNREYIKSEATNELLPNTSVKVAARKKENETTTQKELPEKEFGFDISPNPNDGNFIITVEAKEVQPFVVEIFNAAGTLVSKKEYGGVHQVSVSQGGLPLGVYLVKVTMGANVLVKKIVVN